MPGWRESREPPARSRWSPADRMTGDGLTIRRRITPPLHVVVLTRRSRRPRRSQATRCWSPGRRQVPHRLLTGALPLLPGSRVVGLEVDLPQQPESPLDHGGAPRQPVAPGVLVDERDIVVRQGHAQLHTAMLLRGHRGSNGVSLARQRTSPPQGIGYGGVTNRESVCNYLLL